MTDDEIYNNKLNLRTERNPDMPIIIGDGGVRPASDYQPGEGQEVLTVLGAKRTNPFSVGTMTAAWNRLYDDNRTDLPKTHSYIKVKPQSDRDIEILRSYMVEKKIPFFDFPLEYEITTMGDYYIDPQAPKPEWTFQYAVIPDDMLFPDVPYEIVEDLVMAPYDSYLTYTAFLLTGNPFPYQSIEGDIMEDIFPPSPACGLSCADFPDCLLPWNDCGNIITTLPLPDCHPEDPDWPDCLKLDPRDDSDPDPDPDPPFCDCTLYQQGQAVQSWIVPSADGDCSQYEQTNGNEWVECNIYTPPPPPPPPPSPYVTNSCGCEVYAIERKPGGCVKVLNTNSGRLDGVRKAAIHLKDDWFTTDIVFTNDNGCWKLNDNYYGRMWMWVKFYNFDATIRVRRGLVHYGDLFWPADDFVGMFWGPKFNNISVEYWGDNNIDGTNQMHWACATTQNAVQEYHDNPDGIPIHSDLNIILSNSESNTGGAPMLHNGFSTMTNIVDFLVAVSLGPPGLVAIIGAHDILYPDITYGYQTLTEYENDFNFLGATENIREVIFHECAHASHHFYGNGPFNNWDRIRCHIVSNWIASLGNDVYGEPGNFAIIGSDPQYVAVAEGWAHHYGFALLNTTGGNNFLENIHFRNNFIPWGLGNDLSDLRRQFDPSGYNDQVEGFTNQQYFNALMPHVVTMETIRSIYLIQNLGSTTNTPAQVNSLFDEYNF